MKVKECVNCHKTLPIENFRFSKSIYAKDGLQSWCIDCQDEYNRMRAQHPEGIKKCRKCGKIKSRNDFNKCSHHKDGLQSYCKECDREHGNLRNGSTGKYREPENPAKSLIDELKIIAEKLRDKGYGVVIEITKTISL